MKLKWIIYLIAFVISHGSIAQTNCDYTNEELEGKTVEIINLSKQNLDSAYNLAVQLESCFQRNPDYVKMSLARLCLGDVLERKGSYDLAIEKYSFALSELQKAEDLKYEIQALYSLGHAYSMKGNFPLSLKYYLASSDLAMSHNDLELIVETDLQLAEYYRRRENYEKSLEYLNRVRSNLTKNELDVSYEIRMLNRFAAVWTETSKNLDSIVLFSKKSLHLAESIGDLHNQALAYNEMGGRAEFFTVEERVQFYKKAKSIWADMHYVRYECLPTMHLINLWYIPNNMHQESIELLTPMVKQLPDNSWEKDVMLQQLSGAYESMGDYKSALEINRARFLTVSLGMKEATDKQVEELTLNYEARKTEEALASKSADLAVEKAEKDFFILLVIALVALSFIVIVSLIINYRKNLRLRLQQKEIVEQSEELRVLLQEKEVLLKEVNHRVKNNMIMVSSILEMQQETTEDANLKQSLQTGVDRVRSLAYAHQQLYQTENYTDIELNSYLKTIGENLLVDSDVQMELLFDRAFHFSIEKAQAIGFVINELITNSLKHAWKDRQSVNGKKIKIQFSENESHLTVNYFDDGVGVDEEKMNKDSSSLGLLLINSFVSRQLDGEITFESANGAKIQFTCRKD